MYEGTRGKYGGVYVRVESIAKDVEDGHGGEVRDFGSVSPSRVVLGIDDFSACQGVDSTVNYYVQGE